MEQQLAKSPAAKPKQSRKVGVGSCEMKCEDANPLSPEEINLVWLQAYRRRLVKVLGCEESRILTVIETPVGNIQKNLTKGVETVRLPSWLPSAMKTLANWPNGFSGSDQSMCIFSYQGFEKDVFKLITEFFGALSGLPLLTYALYDAILTAYMRGELFELNASVSTSMLCGPLNSPVAARFGMLVKSSSLDNVNVSDGTSKSSQFLPGRTHEGFMSSEGKRMAVGAFRIITLVLSPSLRKYLKLLLEFMAEIGKNEKLMLDAAMPTKELVINTFYKMILNCLEQTEFDEQLAIRIVTFMVDNYAEIFAIEEEEDLIREIKENISEKQRAKVPVEGVAAEGPIKFCVSIGTDEFEDQRLVGQHGTAKGLRDLLKYYMNDPTLSNKVRRNKLVKFREEYPHIFYEKCGDSEIDRLNKLMKNEKRKKLKRLAGLLSLSRGNKPRLMIRKLGMAPGDVVDAYK